MIDFLIDKIREKQNPTVVGLDPTYEMIPYYIKKDMLERFGKTPRAVAEMFLEFNKRIVDSVYDLVPAVKPQIAMYEQYGLEGVRAYISTIEYAKEKGLIVIGDIKRGDISSTARAYASHIGGVEIDGEFYDLWKEDAVTVNPYLGTDGIEPFINYCKERDRGIFVLVKTSNPSSKEIQDRLIDGEPLYFHVAQLVKGWGEDLMGQYGYSRVGAVVGATQVKEGEALRNRMPNTFFLVPGYGAQGGKGEDLKGYFDKDGLGIIVNSSRGIIAAYRNDDEFADVSEIGPEFAQASRKAVIIMREDLQRVM
ncbi:MAG: orotidine-5'-phosphate decarboxylase [Clostridiales bacterium]|nr:orotidine-5'-phosphate decarboxylase [Clostridiales bacterium]